MLRGKHHRDGCFLVVTGGGIVWGSSCRARASSEEGIIRLRKEELWRESLSISYRD